MRPWLAPPLLKQPDRAPDSLVNDQAVRLYTQVSPADSARSDALDPLDHAVIETDFAVDSHWVVRVLYTDSGSVSDIPGPADSGAGAADVDFFRSVR